MSERKKKPTAPPAHALRYNSGKLRLGLIPFEWEEELAIVLGVGARKYKEDNWKLSLNTDDHNQFKKDRFESARRHILAWQKGEEYDPENGETKHLAQAAWNLLAIMYYEIYEGKPTPHADFIRVDHDKLYENEKDGPNIEEK